LVFQNSLTTIAASYFFLHHHGVVPASLLKTANYPAGTSSMAFISFPFQ